ncbi:cell cycle checkpoint protein RAD17-like [Bolinopsis microptera]|uniref:cell cycle checkpoint protein RAD17-like n=1 Tax=Bolinopsis microptera TaxID=2820187 RepID=UPI00307A593E
MSRSLTTRKPSKEWGFESDFASSANLSTTDQARRTDKQSGEEKQCWLIKHAPKTRWSKGLTSVQFFEKILLPHIESVRASINNPEQKALLISDVFRAQHTQTLKDLMTANNCILQKVPANMTHHLQPLDISINGLAKKFMRNKYEDWGDLAMHKKKIESLSKVLTESLTHKRHKIIILSGPPGVGKSATVRALANDMSCSFEEWVNPIMTYEKGMHYESEVAKFRDFLLSSSRYNSPQEFWDIIKTYSRTGLYPVVLIISDSVSNVKIPPEHLNIPFNPVADTLMTKALRTLVQKEKLSDINVGEIVARSEGDLRNAVLSLQFNGVTTNHTSKKGPTKRRKIASKESKTKTSTTGKDSTLFFFHALGKFLYAKRVEGSRKDCTDTKLGRCELEFVPEEVAEKCAVSGGLLTEFLHHNYLGFQNEIENTLLATDSLCDSDIISSHWTDDKEALDRLDWYSKSLTTRGVVFSKDVSFVPKFMPLCRPVQRDISKTSLENQEKCRDVFALQHMGANSCFLLDTMPFFKKIGYKANNSEEYSLIQKMTYFKTSAKCGVSLNNNEGVEEEGSSVSSSYKKKEDADMLVAKEMEEEIADFSD